MDNDISLNPIQQRHYDRLMNWFIRPFFVILLVAFSLLLIWLCAITFGGMLLALGFLGFFILSLFALAGFTFLQEGRSLLGRFVASTLLTIAVGLLIYAIQHRAFDGLSSVPSSEGIWGLISGFSLGTEIAIIGKTMESFALLRSRGTPVSLNPNSSTARESMLIGVGLGALVGVPIALGFVPGVGLLFALFTGLFAWFSFGGIEILENYALKKVLRETPNPLSSDRI